MDVTCPSLDRLLLLLHGLYGPDELLARLLCSRYAASRHERTLERHRALSRLATPRSDADRPFFTHPAASCWA